jgi:putative protease
MEQEIGKVEDYFAHVGAVALKLTAPLKVGDTIHIKGHTTDFTQEIESMQIEHKSVNEAKIGDDIGIIVQQRVRKHDKIYKVMTISTF